MGASTPALLRLPPGRGRAPALRPASPGSLRAAAARRSTSRARALTVHLARSRRAAAGLAGEAQELGSELRGPRPSP